MSKVSFASRLDRHLATAGAISAAVAGVGVLGTTESAEAAIVYSGPVNLSITPNIDGIYLNLISGATGTSAATVTGYDFNPYVAGSTGATPTWRVLGPTGVFFTDSTAGTVSAVPEGTIISIANTNIGGGGFPTLPTGTNFIGLEFTEAGSTYYGWIQLSLPVLSQGNLAAGTILGYAYDNTPNTPIAAGAGIPEPTSASLLALGAVGLFKRRNKKVA